MARVADTISRYTAAPILGHYYIEALLAIILGIYSGARGGARRSRLESHCYLLPPITNECQQVGAASPLTGTRGAAALINTPRAYHAFMIFQRALLRRGGDIADDVIFLDKSTIIGDAELTPSLMLILRLSSNGR